MSSRALSAPWVVGLVSLWIALLGNAPLWRRLASLGVLDGMAGKLFALAMFAIAWSSVAGLLSLFAWKRTLKPVAAVLLLVTAFAGYFMQSYGVVMDPDMITNALQTDTREVGGLLSWQLVLAVALLALVPIAGLVRLRIDHGTTRHQWLRNAISVVTAVAVVVISALASFQPLAALMRNHKDVRYLLNPMASLYSLGRVAAKPWQRDSSTLVAVGTDAHLKVDVRQGRRPTLLLLVLGETARSDHFGINGYARNTTPTLAKLDVVSFRNAWSCGTSTAASVPCMFSSLTREGFEGRKSQYEGLLDVLQRAGLAVLWIDNQSGCKGVCDRVPSASTTATKDSVHCSAGECLDAVMLEGLDERLAALDAKRRAQGIVIVMHQMGSHGPAYHLRSPTSVKQFAPECTTSALNECSSESVVNAYDNSILYTDRFLGQAIEWLKSRESGADTAMLYVSDHGESLGENNLYLHGLPYFMAPDAQKHVPWVTWASDSYQRNKGLSLRCLHDLQASRVSHDNYFHSVLGLMDVQTTAYDAAMDAYAGCRGVAMEGLRTAAAPQPAPKPGS